MGKNVKTVKEVAQEKSERLMNGVGYWGSFYRKNPQRFVREYLNIHLKLFQKILIYMMFWSTNFMYIASRGSGKTWLTSLYCAVRCILYPGTKICVASGTKGQAIEVITKIETEFLKKYSWGSLNLRNEISFISAATNNARVDFKNGSYIVVVTSNDNARHNRANCIVVDEFRMVDLTVINTVLRKFLTAPRHPGYLDDPKYKHLQERNCEIYMSSAWFKSHWSFEKLKAYFANMLDDTKKYFAVGLPYNLAIKEGLLQKEQVEDEMSEADFDELSFRMEMGAEWYGDTDGSFFRYDDISPLRKVKDIFYPLDIYRKYPTKFKIPELQIKEERILSVDIALMASSKHKNDASALIINRALMDKSDSYTNQIVYVDTKEGLTTDELGLEVMRTFYQYKCTQLCIDTNGSGIGIYDYLTKPHWDSEYQIEYQPLICVNDEAMADRNRTKNALKCIWSIKANASFNTDTSTALRASFQNGRTLLPISEFEAEELVRDIKGYSKFSTSDKAKLKVVYYQTSLLINELINLEYEVKGSNIKLKEKPGMRKDRYSSLQYNIYTSNQLSLKIKPKRQNSNAQYSSIFRARAPKNIRRF